MKKAGFINIFFGIFAAVGLGLLIGAVFSIKNYSDFKAIAVPVNAEIVRIEDYYDSDDELHHQAYVSYSFRGSSYEDIPLSYYSSGMYEGKDIELLCDPVNPGRVRESAPISITGIILLVMGSIFFLVGGLPIVFNIRKAIQRKQLLTMGKVLVATVDSIEYNTSYSVNGRHPFVIYCSYRDEYKDVTYLFKSDNLWTDPLAVFEPGSSIQVLVNEKDYSQYYVKAEEVIGNRIVDFT